MSNKNIEDSKSEQKKDNTKSKEKKGEWKGYFEEVIYSSGSNDNIYVYG